MCLMSLEGCAVEKMGTARATFPHAVPGSSRGAHWTWPRCPRDLAQVGLVQPDCIRTRAEVVDQHGAADIRFQLKNAHFAGNRLADRTPLDGTHASRLQ